ncbi:MAG TPA: cytochrome c3 family protein [Gemmataceae bacterium]
MPVIFSRDADRYARQGALAFVLAVTLFVAGFYYYALPSYTRVGFAPEQPVPYSHALHVGQLGLDCRYCHSQVFESPHSNVPSTETCMNCHNPEKANVKGNSPLLAALRQSWRSGLPVEWKRVHKLPEYAYFNHAVHVSRGVSCVSCHGPVNEMDVVYQAEPLSMGWCLNCHQQPEPHLRPRDQVTNLDWRPEPGRAPEEVGRGVKERLSICPPDNCQACHR